ncbi:DUF6351 family protein [uncultured Halovibrio sp.]|uniref:DUF6351 family protein n=1 Tax=uncultured Halovibrio sp. TaxID=985049 RepID=UPI0025FE99B6|nr:DUF6351 family protein [uncultured Halovibrio sp.]
MMRNRLLLVATATLMLTGCPGDSDSGSGSVTNDAGPDAGAPTTPGGGNDDTGAPALREGEGQIEVLSNRADLVSAGNALVAVESPDLDDARYRLNGEDVTSRFQPDPANAQRTRALLEGLQRGRNELRVRLGNNTFLSRTLVNHPAGGPVFSGPQIEPWNCTNDKAVDAQCNQPPEYSFRYVPASALERLLSGLDPQDPGTDSVYKPYDPENPPPDHKIATTTTDEGKEVPFIVRVETGVLNRDRYRIATLYQPGEDWSALDPQPQWNGKLLIHHGGNVGVSYSPGTPPEGDISGLTDGNEVLLGDSTFVALSRGFATLSTAQADLGHNANLVTAAESLVMAKEHLIEQYGPIRYTIGTGCSGGAIAQQHVANAYPGIYQGLIVQCSYPDVWTTATQFAEYNLLNRYFGNRIPDSPEGFLDVFESIVTSGVSAPQWPFFYGHLPLNPVVSDLAFFPAAYPDQDSCPGIEDQSRVYDPETNPGGLRCGLIDHMRTQFGPRAPENWSETEQMLGRGFTGLPLDNQGVQYGLQALRKGLITRKQFLEVNRGIGGFNIDVDPQPERTEADPQALENAYRTGAINTADNLGNVPIIDLRGPDPGIAHDAYHSWQMRARIEKAQGDADNHVIWFGAFPLAGDTVFTAEALMTMDQWLANIESEATDRPMSEKITTHRPDFARDRCLSLSGLSADWGPILTQSGALVYPDPVIPGVDSEDLPQVPGELGQVLDLATNQVCGLDLEALGIPSVVTDLLSPITDPVVEAQQTAVQTRFGTPRTVAGDDIRTLTNKCQLKPVDPEDYPDWLTGKEAFLDEVREIFPNGVCDFDKPPKHETETLTWLQYGDAQSPTFGGKPLPRQTAGATGWASKAFNVSLNPKQP